MSRAPDRVAIEPVQLRSPLHERAKGRTLRLERDTRRVDERLSRDDLANVGDALDQNRGCVSDSGTRRRSRKQAAARGIELEGPETVHHHAAGHDE